MNLRTNPELLPHVEWWEKDGKSTVIWLLVAAIAVGGWYGWKNHKAAVKAAASDALVNAYTTEENEDAAAKFAGSATEGALKMPKATYFTAVLLMESTGRLSISPKKGKQRFVHNRDFLDALDYNRIVAKAEKGSEKILNEWADLYEEKGNKE